LLVFMTRRNPRLLGN